MVLDQLDFDRMHGVWVTDTKFPKSFGRVAFREYDSFWIMWIKHGVEKRDAASLEPFADLKFLRVAPEPWFVKCSHCGEYGLPLGYSKESLEVLRDPTI